MMTGCGNTRPSGRSRVCLPNMERRFRETDSAWVKEELGRYQSARTCEVCNGDRLKPEALAVKIAGRHISQVAALSIAEAGTWFSGIAAELTPSQREIAERILKEINERLGFLKNVGLEYLTLSRASGTLSGGESQRIRLASQIGSGLTGVLYVLDEPSIGLHQRDNGRLLATLKRLRDLGNTVIVVEHDEEAIRTADWVVDMGPGAGVHGGHVVAEGTPEAIMRNPDSITGQYLTGQRQIPVPPIRRIGHPGQILRILDARGEQSEGHHRRDPARHLLLRDRRLGRRQIDPDRRDPVQGARQTAQQCARAGRRAWRARRGRVSRQDRRHRPVADRPHAALEPGDLYRLLHADPRLVCRAARGQVARLSAGPLLVQRQGRALRGLPGRRRHQDRDALSAGRLCPMRRLQGPALQPRDPRSACSAAKSIADVLDMTVDEGADFFRAVPAIRDKLLTLQRVGLGYIHIGQPATTLSGGEAQRVKLAKELSRRATGRTLYILDEPTTGLHFDDVRKLLDVLHALVETGNTVLVIEHNLEVIKTADWIIDLGPEGGDAGGHIVATGTPEDVAACAGELHRPVPPPLPRPPPAPTPSSGVIGTLRERP